MKDRQILLKWLIEIRYGEIYTSLESLLEKRKIPLNRLSGYSKHCFNHPNEMLYLPAESVIYGLSIFGFGKIPRGEKYNKWKQRKVDFNSLFLLSRRSSCLLWYFIYLPSLKEKFKQLLSAEFQNHASAQKDVQYTCRHRILKKQDRRKWNS